MDENPFVNDQFGEAEELQKFNSNVIRLVKLGIRGRWISRLNMFVVNLIFHQSALNDYKRRVTVAGVREISLFAFFDESYPPFLCRITIQSQWKKK